SRRVNTARTSSAVSWPALRPHDTALVDSCRVEDRDSKDRAVPGRLQLLDLLRGIAALSVMLFHFTTGVPGTGLGRILATGWLGVFIFFPISGYCIAAATHRNVKAPIASFLRRRWTRIYPPYLASIALTVLVALIALPFNRGSASEFDLGLKGWSSVLTLTQVFTGFQGRINPVYWSLCYEEQLYLVMALSLWIRPATWRPYLLTAITVAAIVCNAAGWTVKGLFFDYWVPFASGIAVYYIYVAREHRRIGYVLLAVCVVSGALLSEIGTLVSLATAAVILALAPFDRRLNECGPLKPMFLLGLISYSLYLIHVPVGGRVVNLMLRFDVGFFLRAAAATSVSLVAAYLFFRVIEARFLPRHQRTMAERVLPHSAAR
ncbi:MAG: acyltransferase family protein, partial [Candidatus Dormibacteria bacterium]